MKRSKLLPQIALTAILGFFALLMSVPLLLTFTNSLMTETEIGMNYGLIGQMTDVAAGGNTRFVNLKLLPDWLSFGQYREVLILNSKFLRMFWNSVGMVVPIIAGQTLVASLAAYAFAKLRFRGRDKLFLVYLLTMLMPFQVTLVPNYLVASTLGLMNKEAAIILPGVFGAFGVFMLRQFMAHIPGAYAEAAKMDGAGEWTVFRHIAIPLAKPGLAALAVLLFVDYWNMIEQPLLFLEDSFKQPLSLYLARIASEERGVGFAASVLYMTPMLLLFFYAESYFIQGVQMSGIKG
ncbi:carbohydrate ABC transporter permease [Paenibacillus sp. MBLB2552]|uniref:Carbohydrate ABC transporter permease n=1 Tax=Paenibacillus mellifer TaxID=2937794 RepID=A0A9X1XYB1_9BACL|nr:carbohydrate ABC transporter permease [Paenibacillus mellifer]MCK8486946.1 carbohydrate ABC transporter permease [Paenibacillus mellifer]